MLTLKRLLCLVIADTLLAGLLLQVVTHHLWAVGAIPDYSRGTVFHDLSQLAKLSQELDSWDPMLSALRSVHNPSGVYQAVFFEQKVKFQYPLTSLLPMWLMQRSGLSTGLILNLLNVFSALAAALTIAVCLLIGFKSTDNRKLHNEEHSRLMFAGVVILISTTFFPVMWSYAIGQIQVFLNLLFSIAFLCWLTRRERTAGALIGLITLVKPQYVLILLWGFLRKRLGFALSGLAVTSAGVAASLAVFGLRNNLQYFGVLSFLSRHGEAFYQNQSFNGFLNRLVGTVGNAPWHAGYPPYRPAIYIATIVTSLGILAWAVPLRVRASEKNRVLDFSLIGIVATAASPIAWAHHYGIVLPILIWQIGAFVVGAKLSRIQSVAFVGAYLLIANDFRITNLLAHSALNIVQSYLFFGVLVLIGLLKSELEPLSDQYLPVAERSELEADHRPRQIFRPESYT